MERVGERQAINVINVICKGDLEQRHSFEVVRLGELGRVRCSAGLLAGSKKGVNRYNSGRWLIQSGAWIGEFHHIFSLRYVC